ncbi:hypothetical protein N183_34880 [Sinorhizobium sp. Sb3]|nr:hypothetical protein N183_34880 [Sinorhizobium sp. Sb3]
MADGQKISLRFDAARAKQDFPVVPAGCLSECCGQDDNIHTLISERPKKFGKAQVVANRTSNDCDANPIGHEVVAARNVIGFPIARSVRRIDIEQMYLAVAGILSAIRPTYERRVVEVAPILFDD